MRELTPEEEAELLGMAEATNEADQPYKFDFSEKKEYLLINSLLTNEAVSSQIDRISSKHFRGKFTMAIVDTLKSFYTAQQALPTKQYVMETVAQKFDQAADKLQVKAIADSIYEYYAVNPPTAKQIVAEVGEFIRRFKSLEKINQAYSEDSKLTETERYAVLSQSFAELRKEAETSKVLATWADIVATQEKEEWLIENWLEFGSLGMIAGDPFAGKSTLMAEIVASIVTGEKFGPHHVPKCAVLLIDPENKKRILVERLTAVLGDRVDLLQPVFRRVGREINYPATNEVIKDLINETKKNTGLDKVFVMIDTFRSVLGADEMEVKETCQVLYSLQGVAHETNSAIIVLHHRPKSGAAYSGQSSIAGACDYLWLWESDRSTQIGELTLVGTRGCHQKPMTFKFENNHNVYVTKSASDMKFSSDLEQLEKLATSELGNGAKLSKSELIKTVSNQWTGKAPKDTKLYEMLNVLTANATFCVEKGKHNADIIFLPIEV